MGGPRFDSWTSLSICLASRSRAVSCINGVEGAFFLNMRGPLSWWGLRGLGEREGEELGFLRVEVGVACDMLILGRPSCTGILLDDLTVK